jgi:hypothetical protein
MRRPARRPPARHQLRAPLRRLFGNLPRYDNSVCPDGSTVPQICDENISTHTAAGLKGATPAPTQAQPPQQTVTPEQQKQIQNILNGTDPNKLPDDAKKKLQDLLPGVKLPDLPQLPDLGQLPQSLGLGSGASGSSSSGSTTQDLLNFLLGQ